MNTFTAKSRSRFAIIEEREAMLQDLIGSAEPKLSDERKVVPDAAASVVHLALQSVNLFLLRFAHHLRFGFFSQLSACMGFILYLVHINTSMMILFCTSVWTWLLAGAEGPPGSGTY